MLNYFKQYQHMLFCAPLVFSVSINCMEGQRAKALALLAQEEVEYNKDRAFHKDFIEIDFDLDTGKPVTRCLTLNQFLTKTADESDLGPAERFRPERYNELQKIFMAKEYVALYTLYSEELETVKRLYSEADIAAVKASCFKEKDFFKRLLQDYTLKKDEMSYRWLYMHGHREARSVKLKW